MEEYECDFISLALDVVIDVWNSIVEAFNRFVTLFKMKLIIVSFTSTILFLKQWN